MMKVLFAASECVPFVKTGGLADVVGALPKEILKNNVDVRVILPLYREIPKSWRDKMTHKLYFYVNLGWRRQYCGIEELVYEGITFYFVDNEYYFGRPYVYGLGGDEYERYGFFCRACLNALPLLDFSPDIIHAHDWQSGMIPALLKIQYAHLPFYAHIRTMFTIHNLQYQGIFGIKDVQDVLGLGDGLWTSDNLECFGCANFMKAGLVYADAITTVSPSYAEEITTAYYGERLDGLIRARRDSLYGVLNGIDMQRYDPSRDKSLAAAYSPDDLAGKKKDKAALQRVLGLQERPDTPILAMVTRLVSHKGLDLVCETLDAFMGKDVQFVVLGKGDAKYETFFEYAKQRYGGRMAVYLGYSEQLAMQIYAGADLFLMPSKSEPCGLSQMIAMRYGAVPIVRETGGLKDTVKPYNQYTGEGNGFSFANYNAHEMKATVERAVNIYRYEPEVWTGLMRNAMSEDFSFARSAEEYARLYIDML